MHHLIKAILEGRAEKEDVSTLSSATIEDQFDDWD